MIVRKTSNNNDEDIEARLQSDFGYQPAQIAVLSKHTIGTDV
jgi:hypothetical protein